MAASAAVRCLVVLGVARCGPGGGGRRGGRGGGGAAAGGGAKPQQKTSSTSTTTRGYVVASQRPQQGVFADREVLPFSSDEEKQKWCDLHWKAHGKTGGAKQGQRWARVCPAPEGHGPKFQPWRDANRWSGCAAKQFVGRVSGPGAYVELGHNGPGSCVVGDGDRAYPVHLNLKRDARNARPHPTLVDGHVAHAFGVYPDEVAHNINQFPRLLRIARATCPPTPRRSSCTTRGSGASEAVPIFPDHVSTGWYTLGGEETCAFQLALNRTYPDTLLVELGYYAGAQGKKGPSLHKRVGKEPWPAPYYWAAAASADSQLFASMAQGSYSGPMTADLDDVARLMTDRVAPRLLDRPDLTARHLAPPPSGAACPPAPGFASLHGGGDRPGDGPPRAP
ncbi:hypothetical protein JL720_10303 [Aureococcus anophagefferens]|nr:hypothetical protein JL720_10303 [Aureococcus anophagefferens]